MVSFASHIRTASAFAILSAVVALLLASLLITPLDESSGAPLLHGMQKSLAPRVSQIAHHLAKAAGVHKGVGTAFTTPQQSSTQKYFSSTSKANMSDKMDFKEAVKNRRSIYQLEKKSPISDERIKEILTTAIEDVPSSFNSQSSRLVVLLKEEHTKFWDIVTTILKAHVPEDKWEHTGSRLTGFQEAYGTVLFYEDPDPIHELQKKFPQYADKFPQWSEHTSAMHQYMLWTAFEAEGFGCNLQHYNPLPDEKAAAEWKIPLEWSLKSQLVFGQPQEGAREKLSEKQRKPVEDRLKIYGM